MSPGAPLAVSLAFNKPAGPGSPDTAVAATLTLSGGAGAPPLLTSEHAWRSEAEKAKAAQAAIRAAEDFIMLVFSDGTDGLGRPCLVLNSRESCVQPAVDGAEWQLPFAGLAPPVEAPRAASISGSPRSGEVQPW